MSIIINDLKEFNKLAKRTLVGVAYKGIGTEINLEMVNSINDLLRAFVSAIKQEEIYSEGLK